MKKLRCVLTLFCLCRGVATPAPVAVDLRNASFEEQKDVLNGDGDGLAIGVDPGDYTVSEIPQWSAAAAGLFHPDTPLDFAPDGDLVIYMDSNSTVSQPLVFPGGSPVTAQPGLKLTFTASARGRLGGRPDSFVSLRAGNVTVSDVVPLDVPANPGGYSAVSVPVLLKDVAALGESRDLPLTLVITNSGQQLNLDEVAATVVYLPSINQFSATPQPATAGQPVTLSWDVSGAEALSLNGQDVSGRSSLTVAAPSTPAGYTLTASGTEGSTTRSVTVDVLPGALPPPPVRISEVMTQNLSGLTDEDGTRQDWIELQNMTAAPVTLTGWHLTDSRSDPARWTFPATVIPARGFLVVFASSKDRITTPLHTNFSLDSGGEYLALTDTGGQVVSQLDIPPLPAGQSYGYGTGPTREPSVISAADAAVKWTVPPAAVPDDWRGGAAFDDSAWADGQWELGFDTTSTTAQTIAAGTAGNQSYSGALGMDFDVNDPVQVTELGCFDSGSNGLSRTITVVLWSRNRNGTPASTADDLPGAVLASQTFTAAAPGTLTGGQRFTPLAAPLDLAPGSYTIVAYNYGSGEPNGNGTTFGNNTGSAGGALAFTGTGRYGVTQPPASPAASWPGTPDAGPAARYGAGTFRFRRKADFATGTLAQMQNVNATVLTRTAFSLAPGEVPLHPTLEVTYDDGFVAWLNGVEVARRNAPDPLLSDSQATVAGGGTVRIPLDSFAGAFRSGTNLLAIQGLNASPADPDFRLRATLSGETTGEILAFPGMANPGAANGPALPALSLVINEIHCDPPDSKSQFVEFVELFNPLATEVDAGGWQITGGLSCRIPPDTMIPAGGYLVIAENPSHLQTALGYAGALGPWSGSLRNEGDEVVLRRPDLSVADRVSYGSGFPWPTVGDAPGHSLQRISERLDGDLGASWRGALPTPGARNSVAASTAPPAIRQVDHTPDMPAPDESVSITARITDPDRIAAAWLEYQIVEPGRYIRLTDAAWDAGWITLPMTDDGTGGDTDAGDEVYTATIPASVQQHRRLIRYRIRAWDATLQEVRVPYADDRSPNFAYFCYGGVPAWRAAVRPGVTPADTFPAATMNQVRAWHLLSDATDVQNCQYNAGFNDGTYRFEGALVIDGKVYDHIHYRVKGQNSTFNTGKNKWKLRFNRGHLLRMPDDYGRERTTVETLNITSTAAPWAPWNRGLHGLDEAMAFRLSALAGVPAPRTSYLQLRVIDGASEQNPADQFDGDLWGLYLAFENTDNHFKDEHQLEDGNIFRLQVTGAGNSLLGQGRGQPGDLSDLNAFTSTTAGYRRGGGSAGTAPLVTAIQSEAWFRANVDLPEYFSWRAVTEAINQTDRREQENVVYLRRPPAPDGDGRWQILPWDCDLLYENFDRWGPRSVQTAVNLQQYEQIARGLLHPAILTEFQNRARELQDLLLNEDQAGKVADEFVSIMTGGAPRIIPDGGAIDPGFVEADRRRWDYHPANPVPPRGAGATGNYYRTPYPIANMTNGPPQPYSRVLATADFAGMVKWVKDFIATGPNGGARLAKMAAGEVAPYTLASTAPVSLPDTPVITYSGPAGFPLNQLQFTSSGYQSPDGQEFSAMQWRLGEVYDPSVPGFVPGEPWRYEISDLWTSAEMPAFSATIPVPATGLSPGRTYRARVKHRDSQGRWSHWSAPLTFIAGPAVPGDLLTSLVVSEIMYNPPAPEGGDAEFIELLNIHPTAVLDLSGVQFTEGITCTLGEGTLLAPGARLVLVRNAAVFAATYPGVAIGGLYSGSLDNGGEQITLSLGAGTTLRSFRYDNKSPWPAQPDNGGASLVLVSPFQNPDHSLPGNWRSGLPTPGAGSGPGYAAWRAANGLSADSEDPDGDGLGSLLEYATGSGPAVPSTAALPALTRDPAGQPLLTFTRSTTADDVTITIQTSAGLTEWTPAPVELVSRTEGSDTEALTFRVPPGVPEDVRFYRLRVSTP